MNTTEHIIEAYYRYCKKCFTVNDVKVVGGNNRQIDLLAINLTEGIYYHVETTVTHGLKWKPQYFELVTQKFLGYPKPKSKKLDRYYLPEIKLTYQQYGIPKISKRIICTWVTEIQVEDLNQELNGLTENKYEDIISTIELLSLRDQVIPDLQNAIGTSFYEDEILRTMSLLKQRELQVLNSIKKLAL
ncbi:MAG TPA: hypothetical protein VL443_14065 [Cyclobacteriaceae bacterium]|jgi:hypothetical protein|nr:hypothetical protein [Cyclobacteriaceae bacterium]